jgi:hypothetical protein
LGNPPRTDEETLLVRRVAAGDEEALRLLYDRLGRPVYALCLRIVRASEAPLDFDVLAITPEPAGGSPGPTGEIMLAGALRGE